MITQEISVKTVKAPESFMELARTIDGYLFDEVVIKKIELTNAGRVLHYEYRRHGQTFTDLQPLTVSAEEFRASAAGAKTPADFAKTSVAQKLFADGARQYASSNRPTEANAMADMAWIDSMQSDGNS